MYANPWLMKVAGSKNPMKSYAVIPPDNKHPITYRLIRIAAVKDGMPCGSNVKMSGGNRLEPFNET
jgi:hypothetical protein